MSFLTAAPSSKLVTSLPVNRKTRRAGKIPIITSFKCANLTVYVYQENNKCLLDLISKSPLCDFKNTYEFYAVDHFLQGTSE
jgi:hypothetical protein